MSDTLGSLRAEILLELRGDLTGQGDVPLLNSKINNSIENIFLSMMQVQIARFLGVDSPVTFSLPAGAERVQLVSIQDPTIAPVIAAVAGGALAQHTVLGAYTYVTESGSETQLSPTASFVVPVNQLGTVTPPAAVAGAFGWNFYASVTNNALLMGLQNQQPLNFSQSFLEPNNGWSDYPQNQQLPPVAQNPSVPTPIGSPPPSENQTADNISYIKHLEIRTTDTVLRAWNQYDIDSEVFKRFGRTVSSASEYQVYVWDLINGNRLEFRPTTGLAFNPRYWYIAKPRRLRYDQAEIPYVSIAGVHEFLTEYTIAFLKLTLDEYLSHQAHIATAGQIKTEILKSLRQEDFNKNTHVTPHLY
jgi:hypothetical protein